MLGQDSTDDHRILHTQSKHVAASIARASLSVVVAGSCKANIPQKDLDEAILFGLAKRVNSTFPRVGDKLGPRVPTFDGTARVNHVVNVD